MKNPGLTALWEQALNQIAEGTMTLSDFMKKQEDFIRMLMNNCLKQGINWGKIEIRKCPLCGKPMRKIQHAKGTFWGCSGYPECQHKEADKKSVSKVKKSSTANVTQQIANLRSLIK